VYSIGCIGVEDGGEGGEIRVRREDQAVVSVAVEVV
jgi:hypothetical protein